MQTTATRQTEGNAQVIFDELARSNPVRIEDNKKMLDALGLSDLSGKALMDLGCGLGGLLVASFSRGLDRAKGVDISPQSIEGAKKTLGRFLFDGKASLECCDISKLRPGEKFDYITAMGVITYLKAPLAALDEWMRYLKENGSLFVLFNKYYPFDWVADIFRAVLSRLPFAFHKPICWTMSVMVLPLQGAISGRKLDVKTVYEKVYNQVFSRYYHRFDKGALRKKLEEKYLIEEINVPKVEFTSPKTTFLFRLKKK